jgi:glycosyltransferase involved in cell wall biosynthesis
MGSACPRPVLLLIRRLHYGGTERQLAEIARGLDRSRFTPHIGCFIEDGILGRELRGSGIPIVQFHVRSFTSFSLFSGAFEMARYIERHRIELVHTFDVPANLFGVIAARTGGARVVVSSQRAYRGLTGRGRRALLRITDRMVDGVVVNCDAMRRHMIEDEKAPPGLIHLCYNSVDTEMFHPRERWWPAGLEDASLVIGVACRLSPEKGLDTLIDAFARVSGLDSGSRLLIVGDGESLPALEARVRALGIENRCVFMPPVGDIERWLQAFDIFVLPSLSEALSNSLMEAMASGCCAVASTTGGNPELVQHGRTGLLFAPGDVEDLAAQLRRLIEDRTLREQLSLAGAKFIAETFSRQVSVAQIEATYTRLLGDGAR